MSDIHLNEIFQDDGIRDFGIALRKALRMGDDYASLIELEYVESKEAFAEWLKKFLRRYDGLAKKYRLRRPQESSLIKLTKMVDDNGVKTVRAALISWSLVKTNISDNESTEEEGIHV